MKTIDYGQSLRQIDCNLCWEGEATAEPSWDSSGIKLPN
jgi:hypothetical protein